MTTGGQTKWRRAACTQPGFDDTLYLKPGVGEWLVRMPGALRPIVQATLGHLCSRAVARPGGRGLPGRVPFGSSRASLQRVKSPLREAQGASCFYCGSQVSASGTEVDHFIPWSRRPDNGLHNLVAAHTVCNNAKRDSLAGTEHWARWLKRLAAGRGEHPGPPIDEGHRLLWNRLRRRLAARHRAVREHTRRQSVATDEGLLFGAAISRGLPPSKAGSR